MSNDDDDLPFGLYERPTSSDALSATIVGWCRLEYPRREAGRPSSIVTRRRSCAK
jgi:hypothetical protein